MYNKKLIAIVGPTASGKTALSILLAKQFNGEVVSADSRQVYKGMSAGSGKVTKKEMSGIPHHMLDVVSPRTQYSVSRYKKDAERALKQIFNKNKIPIIVGGTGQYIDALIFDKQLPEVIPDYALRKKLEIFSNEKMFAMLQKLDPRRAGEIDRHNPRRLIRAIEIAKKIGSVPDQSTNESKYEVLWIGLKPDDNTLKKNIHSRLIKRVTAIKKEVSRLRDSRLSWKKLESFGLEYRYFALYLQGKMNKEEMLEKLETESWRYAKRQYTWFKRNKEIIWFAPEKTEKIQKLTQKFLS